MVHDARVIGGAWEEIGVLAAQHAWDICQPCAHTCSKQAKNASAGNRTRVTSMATMYSTTRPLMLMLAATSSSNIIYHGLWDGGLDLHLSAVLPTSLQYDVCLRLWRWPGKFRGGTLMKNTNIDGDRQRLVIVGVRRRLVVISAWSREIGAERPHQKS